MACERCTVKACFLLETIVLWATSGACSCDNNYDNQNLMRLFDFHNPSVAFYGHNVLWTKCGDQQATVDATFSVWNSELGHTRLISNLTAETVEQFGPQSLVSMLDRHAITCAPHMTRNKGRWNNLPKYWCGAFYNIFFSIDIPIAFHIHAQHIFMCTLPAMGDISLFFCWSSSVLTLSSFSNCNLTIRIPIDYRFKF